MVDDLDRDLARFGFVEWITLGRVERRPRSFINLGAQMFIGGSGVVMTNYLDVSGATNKPARYYRVRLVP